jgi:hypothetical protein
MFKYGLSNIRRLRDVPPIEIRPITILVSRNSSGKSTYLRSLALLRQSITTRTPPILWYGDSVDFGSYDVPSSDKTNHISFSFHIDTINQTDYLDVLSYNSHFLDSEVPYRGITYTAAIIPNGQRTRISTITLSIDSLAISFVINVNEKNSIDSVKINGADSKSLLADISLDITTGSIFPEINAVRKREESEPLSRAYYRYHHRNRVPELIEAFLRSHLSKKISKDTLHILSNSILTVFLDKENVLSKKVKSIDSWKRFVDKVNADEGLRKSFFNAIYMSVLPEIMNRTVEALKAVVSNSLYIGPARARSDRYYRYQDLSVIGD